jgi:hypothetical protein
LLARHAQDPVAVQPGAIHQVGGLNIALPGVHHRAVPARGDAQHFAARPKLPSALRYQLGKAARHGGVVGNRGGRHVQRQRARTVRLNFAGLLRREKTKAGQAVGQAALV